VFAFDKSDDVLRDTKDSLQALKRNSWTSEGFGVVHSPDEQSDGWISYVAPNGRTFWHHSAIGPAPWASMAMPHAVGGAAVEIKRRHVREERRRLGDGETAQECHHSLEPKLADASVDVSHASLTSQADFVDALTSEAPEVIAAAVAPPAEAEELTLDPRCSASSGGKAAVALNEEICRGNLEVSAEPSVESAVSLATPMPSVTSTVSAAAHNVSATQGPVRDRSTGRVLYHIADVNREVAALAEANDGNHDVRDVTRPRSKHRTEHRKNCRTASNTSATNGSREPSRNERKALDDQMRKIEMLMW
jgi:hypothetical protein